MNVFKFLILYFLIVVFQKVQSQTLIMNEVSNGPGGNKEYVEFVVVSNAVTYTCNIPTPPCIDIRGWIFDDNSGYHGASGIATGAVRFANNPIWACVPLGTIILIYNNGDRNLAIPPDDLSMIDGNCRIIAPMNSTLFESNATTPGAIACSYPAAGWAPPGNWGNTVLANGGDCARIVDLGGCEVFSVCWDVDNLNNLIYFPGSAATRVYYFNDINPQLQANWTSASALTPGNETPGAPNNALNAAYIAQFNNGCLPITSISVTATSVNAGCTCTGSATANASGSIPGYTYLWSNGQTSATATGLCAGIYTVTATSHIGCSISTTVNITSSSSVSVTVNSQTICVGQSATLTSAGATTYTWNTGSTLNPLTVSPLVTTNYTVTGTTAGCTNTAVATVSVNPLPIVTVNSSTICVGQSATLTSAGATTYTWNTGSILNPLTVSPLTTTNFTVTGASAAGCTNTAVASVLVNPLPIVTVNSSTICVGQSATLTSAGATTYTWNTGSTLNPLTVSPLTTTNFTVTGASAAGCTNTAVASVLVNPLPIVTVNSSTICAGQSATLTSAGATTYTWNTGSILNPLTVSPLTTTNFTVTGASAAGCTNTAVASVLVNPLPIVTVNSSTICVGQSATLTSAGATTYTWNTGSTLNPLTVSPLVTTNFTVTGASAAGCTNTAVASVLVNPLPIVTVNSSTICVGQSATLTSAGATTYAWNTGSILNPLTVSPLTTTNFTVTGTTAGCTNTAIATVSVNPLPIVTVNSSTICEGQSVTLTSAGATTYTWNTGSTLNPLTVSPLTTTNFTVTGTTAGCTNTAIANVSVNPLPIVTVNSSTICEGQSVTLTSAGATTYIWNTGSTLNPLTVSPLTTTNFTVTGTTAGCTNTAVATVSVNPLPIVTVNSSTICLGQSATLTSAGATTYNWNTGSTLNPLTVSPIVTTNYTVAGTTAGCTSTAVATVLVNPNLTLIVNNPTICLGETATLTVTGATTYTWSTGTFGTSLLVSPSSNTSYTINGVSGVCNGSTIATVSVNPLPVVTVNTSTICEGQSATLTSVGATTYSWNTGSSVNPLTVSPIATTDYTVTGTLAGCTNSAVASVSVNPLPLVTVNSSAICVGQSTTLTPAGATTYTWNTGSTLNPLTVSPISTTNYTITGTASGCTNTTVATVSVNPLPIVTVNSSTICVGQSATLTSVGATTYTWDTGSLLNSLTVSPISNTNYTVTGSLAGCTNTAVSSVSVNSLPLVTVNSSTICEGQVAILTSAGATTYSWNTGSTLNPLTVSPLATTDYTVTGTSLFGCSNSINGTVVVIASPTITALASQPIICEGGISNLSAFGAVNYTWSAGGALTSTVSVSPVVTSTYTVTGSNGIGPLICSNSQTVLVTVIPQTTVIASVSHPICVGESEYIYAEGGDTYSWLPTLGVSNPSAFSTLVKPTTTTIYTVTASHSGLCPGTATLEIIVHPLPYVYAGVDTTINMDETYVLQGIGDVPVGFLSPNSFPLICNYCSAVEVSPKETTCYTLKGESEFGCVAYDEVCINVTKDWNVYIPNAFSPNGDSNNEIFIPVGYGLSEIKLYIFDRWGAQIFKSHDDVVGWNGKYNGDPCEQNVYVYKAEIKTMSGLKFFRTGHVTLLSNLK